jgi:hypothetical protein
MPDVVETIRAFVDRFSPERTRVAFLNPDRHGYHLPEGPQTIIVNRLRSMQSIEICAIDARDRTANGLLLADFFDFT